MALHIRKIKSELEFKLSICKSIINLPQFHLYVSSLPKGSMWSKSISWRVIDWLLLIWNMWVWGLSLYKFINMPSFTHKWSSSWYITNSIFALCCFFVAMMNFGWTIIPNTAVSFSLWLMGHIWCGKIIDIILILNGRRKQNSNKICNVGFSCQRQRSMNLLWNCYRLKILRVL